MKNLLKKHRIEDLEILPIEFLSFKPSEAITDEYFGYKYNYKSYKDIEVKIKKNTDPWKYSKYIIKKYIGKPYDDAYSEFCKNVKWWQKDYFKDNFKERYWGGLGSKYSEFIVDENGLIQYNIKYFKYNNYRGPYSVKSHDYETELVHKFTGHKKSVFKPIYEQIPYSYKYRGAFNKIYENKGIKNGKLLYYLYGERLPSHRKYKAQDDDFEVIITKGWIKYFDSKQDPEYKRLKSEEAKYKSKTNKQRRKEALQVAYNFISKDEIQKAKEKQENFYKILAHGFDPIVSFRNCESIVDNLNKK